MNRLFTSTRCTAIALTLAVAPYATAAASQLPNRPNVLVIMSQGLARPPKVLIELAAKTKSHEPVRGLLVG